MFKDSLYFFPFLTNYINNPFSMSVVICLSSSVVSGEHVWKNCLPLRAFSKASTTSHFPNRPIVSYLLFSIRSVLLFAFFCKMLKFAIIFFFFHLMALSNILIPFKPWLRELFLRRDFFWDLLCDLKITIDGRPSFDYWLQPAKCKILKKKHFKYNMTF